MNPESKPVKRSLYPIAGFIVIAASVAPIPFHKMMSCEMSGTVASLTILTIPVTVLLGLLTPKEQGGRFLPLVAAIFATFIHPLFSH